MTEAIKMTPEVVQALNEHCSAMHIDSHIVHLQNAEVALQKVSYEDKSGEKDYLFRFAYELKLIREDFEKLEKTLGYEPQRD